MHCQTAQIVAAPLALSDVDTCPQLQPKSFRVSRQRLRAFDRWGGAGKCEQISIASMLDLLSTERRNMSAYSDLKMFKYRPPPVIPDGMRARPGLAVVLLPVTNSSTCPISSS